MSAKCGMSERIGFANSFAVAAPATIASSRFFGSFDVGREGDDHPEHLVLHLGVALSRAEIGTKAVSDFFGNAPASSR